MGVPLLDGHMSVLDEAGAGWLNCHCTECLTTSCSA